MKSSYKFHILALLCLLCLCARITNGDAIGRRSMKMKGGSLREEESAATDWKAVREKNGKGNEGSEEIIESGSVRRYENTTVFINENKEELKESSTENKNSKGVESESNSEQNGKQNESTGTTPNFESEEIIREEDERNITMTGSGSKEEERRRRNEGIGNENESLETEDVEEDSGNRVQKVLNAFYEVTGVLAEVPRQILLLPIRFGFYPGIKRTQDEIPELIPFPCKKWVNREKATSVHRLRPEDIKVIASLGDSLTSANGAMAYSEDEMRLNYRGVSAMGGGQGNWRKYLTLPNIIKEFSPKLLGYAIGTTDTSSPLAGLNLAENGALDDALLQQTKELVRKIKHDPFIDFEKDWKLVNILIGGNDICNEYCYVESEKDSPEGHRKMIEASLNYLKAKLPRTFVNLIHIPNILQLRNLKNIPFVCYAKHLVLCSCLFGGAEKTKAQSVEATLKGYWKEEERISEMKKYEDGEEFTVVLQPFFLGVPSPGNVDTIFGQGPDLSYFAPDCFHFSQRSNALVANALWNNMLEPVGNKTRGWQPLMERFLCPTENAPYFFTRRNSETFFKTGHQ